MRGWSEPFIDYQLQRLNELKGYMPPFVGSEDERRALATWLADIARRPAFSALPVQKESASGQATLPEREVLR
jgi:hypothetical protein